MTLKYIFIVTALFTLNNVYGRPPSKILGGDPAVIGGFKYLVSVRENGTHICGGAIIDASHILLAGHCVHGVAASNLRVFAGATRLDDKAAASQQVKKIHLHSHYHPPTPSIDDLQNDIAVITLQNPLPLRGNVALVDLPKTDVQVGTVGRFAGWGDTVPDNGTTPVSLLNTKHTILSSADCKSLDSEHGAEGFCTLSANQTSSMCQGDSGGPLVSGNTVLGVASASSCDNTDPVIFAKVFHYLPFVRQALKD